MSATETATSEFSLRPDGIIVQRAKPGVRQELKDAQENIVVYLRLAGDQKRGLLIDIRESGPTGPGVREYYAQNTTHLLASALLVGSSLSQMIGNFFINLNKPVSPCRLFTSETAAIAWLKTFQTRSAGATAG